MYNYFYIIYLVLKCIYTIPMIIIYGLKLIGAVFGLFVVNCAVCNEKKVAQETLFSLISNLFNLEYI